MVDDDDEDEYEDDDDDDNDDLGIRIQSAASGHFVERLSAPAFVSSALQCHLRSQT